MALTLWCDETVALSTRQQLAEALSGTHRWLSADCSPDELRAAEVVIGQPAAEWVIDLPRVRWVHIITAGFTAFDCDPVREALRRKGTSVTNSSAVYADACAEHALAMMLARGRRLLSAHREQLADRAWLQGELRGEVQLLAGETVLLLGFGAIGERLAELLAPFPARVVAFRRQQRGGGPVEVIGEAALPEALRRADHVVDILPLNASTQDFMNAARFAAMRTGSTFYNIGRGNTVDQSALIAELRTGRIHAYLDVTTPEPLPPGHELWTLPGCHITPHAAGGGRGEEQRQLHHILSNLARFERGEPLLNRVI